MARNFSRRNVMTKGTAVVYLIMGVVVILFSVMGIGLSVYNYSYAQRAMSEGDEVYATYTEKWSETKTKTSKSKHGTRKKTKTTYYYANATYTYNGQKYDCHKLSVNSSTKVGDTVRLYVLPENPAKYIRPGQDMGWLIVVIACGMFIIMGGSFVMIGIKNRHAPSRREYISQNTPLADTYNPNTTYQGYNGNFNTYNPNNTYQDYNNNFDTYNSYQENNNNNRW